MLWPLLRFSSLGPLPLLLGLQAGCSMSPAQCCRSAVCPGCPPPPGASWGSFSLLCLRVHCSFPLWCLNCCLSHLLPSFLPPISRNSILAFLIFLSLSPLHQAFLYIFGFAYKICNTCFKVFVCDFYRLSFPGLFLWTDFSLGYEFYFPASLYAYSFLIHVRDCEFYTARC